MRGHLILTVDYEIFGNGLGCVDSCVTNPAERLARLCETYNAPLTFFVEVLEFIAMEKDIRTRQYAEAVIGQLKGLVCKGHDAQLHLHPQFVNAEWDGKIWKVSDKWRCGDLSEEEILRLVVQGKAWLQERVFDSPEGNQCLAFRAGGWCIQPSQLVLKALHQAAFLIDSTVAPGLQNSTPGEWCEFRRAPKKAWWRISKDVCLEAEEGKLFEVPIVTGKIAPWAHLSAIRKHKKDNGGLAEGCVGNYMGPGGAAGRINTIVSKLFSLGRVMLDFSTMPAHVMIAVTKYWIDQHETEVNRPLPIVAIAHTKNFTEASEQHLADYLSWARDQGLQYSTYGKWLETVDE